MKTNIISKFLICTVFFMIESKSSADNEVLHIKTDGIEVLGYQAKPLTNPKGGDKFKAGNFIHPLKTPSGFTVTGIQPPDHLHHMGLWWPWKYIETDGRKVLCWELQREDGIIVPQQSSLTANGFSATSLFVDRKAQRGPAPLLKETLNAKLSSIKELPAKGYNLDLEIIHETSGNKPITISKYRYSGFSIRGTAAWNKTNSTVLTSEGKCYDEANTTRAKWVKIEGAANDDRTAGVLMMSCPENYDFPEKLRTWDTKTHNGAIFVNFNSVQDKPWDFLPGKKYTRKYRLFIYDGSISTNQAEQLWQKYSHTFSEK